MASLEHEFSFAGGANGSPEPGSELTRQSSRASSINKPSSPTFAPSPEPGAQGSLNDLGVERSQVSLSQVSDALGHSEEQSEALPSQRKLKSGVSRKSVCVVEPEPSPKSNCGGSGYYGRGELVQEPASTSSAKPSSPEQSKPRARKGPSNFGLKLPDIRHGRNSPSSSPKHGLKPGTLHHTGLPSQHSTSSMGPVRRSSGGVSMSPTPSQQQQQQGSNLKPYKTLEQMVSDLEGTEEGGHLPGTATPDALGAPPSATRGAGAGGGAAADMLSPRPPDPDDDSDLDAFEQDIQSRIISLPNIVCRAANGDLYLVGLNDVQNMLLKRKLGQEGLAVLKRFQNSTSPPKPRKGLSPSDTEELSPKRKGPKLPGELAAEDSVSNTLAGVGDGNQQVMDAEVAAHLAASLEKIEEHRARLARMNARQLQEEARLAELKRKQELQQQAVDLVVQKIIPEKLVNMALSRRTVKQGAGPGLFDRMRKTLSGIQGPVPGEPSPRPHGDEGAHGKPGRSWGVMRGKVTGMSSRMPFLEAWDKVNKKAKDANKSGWDNLLTLNQIYIKGRQDFQGTTVYVLKCQELGVVPSTQVVQQLGCADANMSHCKLGKRGASALRHALSANTTITSLDITDNGLDAQAVEDIIMGLTSGAMARQPQQRKQLTERMARIDFFRTSKPDMDVNIIPKMDLEKMAEEEARRRAREAAAAAAKDEEDEEEIDYDKEWEMIRSTQQAGNLALRTGAGPPPGHHHEKKPRVVGLPPAASITRDASGRKNGTASLSRVESLTLDENPLGVNGAHIIADLLDINITGYQFLTVINLCKCGIPESGGLLIARALANGNTTLHTLHMSNNSIGNKTAEALGELLSFNRTITDLDLSWNQIKPEGCAALAGGLEDNGFLIKLNLSWNGLENEGVVKLGHMLQCNSTLRVLDVTNTRMGGQACLVLSDGIKDNKVLEVLILNGNAVGDDGARHLMNALKQNNSLRYLGLQGTNMTAAARGNNGVDFNPLAPDGSYSLDLHEPVERAVAIQLCDMDRASKSDMMRNIKVDGRNISSCKNANWPDALPAHGVLACDFVSKRVQRSMKVMEAKKFHALHQQMRSGAGNTMSDKERLSLVEVMAPFSYFYCQQVATILSTFGMGDELVSAAAVLFTRCADLEDNIDLMTNAMQERDLLALHELLGWYSYVRFSNPTGHYEFNLSLLVHRHLTTRLKDVAYSEPESDNWINIIYDQYSQVAKTPGNYGPPQAWKGIVPTNGNISFDFVSNSLPPEDAQPISDDVLMDFLHDKIGIQFDELGTPMADTNYAGADLQVALLRQESYGMFFTCAQVKRVIECFDAGPHRVEIAVMMYALVVDRKSFWTVLYTLRPIEQGMTMWRLGPTTVFDRAHPSMHYILDLANPSHEKVAHMLVDMAGQNNEFPNFWNIRLQGQKRAIVENRNMWGTFTAESFTPFLEFDYIGLDGWELLGKSKAEVEAMAKGDLLDMRTKQARRFELGRIKQMYAYFPDDARWEAPVWQSRALMFKPLLEKPPWAAAWDRIMRLLVRYDSRSGDISGDSYVDDIFYETTEGGDFIGAEELEALLKDYGYNKAEVQHYRRLFDASAQNEDEANPESPMVIDFAAFAAAFLTEPPKALRVREPTVSSPGAASTPVKSGAKKGSTAVKKVKAAAAGKDKDSDKEE